MNSQASALQALGDFRLQLTLEERRHERQYGQHAESEHGLPREHVATAGHRVQRFACLYGDHRWRSHANEGAEGERSKGHPNNGRD